MIKSARDLRDPAALIAINQVSHRLVEVPGVRKVESAAWPAGVPWTDASLSSAAGRLADQLGQQAGSFVPAVTAIKSMKSIIEQMSGAVDQLDSTVNVTLAGARQAQQYLDPMLAAARNLKTKPPNCRNTWKRSTPGLSASQTAPTTSCARPCARSLNPTTSWSPA